MKLQIKTLRAAIVGYFLNLIYYFKKSNNHESVKNGRSSVSGIYPE